MDISLYPHAAPVVKHIAHAAPMIKTVLVGVTYMTAAIASAVSFAVGAGLAWYIRGRGMFGVKVDITNIKNDILGIKSQIAPVAPVAAA